MKSFNPQVIRRYILALALIIVSAAAIAQGNTTRPAAAPVLNPASTLQKNPSDEVLVLKAQLATMQGLTDGMLATVHWSLGTVVLVASLLVGFGWFNASKAHERELASLRSELQSMVTAKTTENRDALEALLLSRLQELAAVGSAEGKKIAEDLAKPLQGKVQELNISLDEVRAKLEYSELKSEARYWETRGVKANELTRYIGILEWGVRQKDGYEMSESLKKIQALLEAGTQVMASTITYVSGILDTLPRDQVIHVEALRLALKNAKTY